MFLPCFIRCFFHRGVKKWIYLTRRSKKSALFDPTVEIKCFSRVAYDVFSTGGSKNGFIYLAGVKKVKFLTRQQKINVSLVLHTTFFPLEGKKNTLFDTLVEKIIFSHFL